MLKQFTTCSTKERGDWRTKEILQLLKSERDVVLDNDEGSGEICSVVAGSLWVLSSRSRPRCYRKAEQWRRRSKLEQNTLQPFSVILIESLIHTGLSYFKDAQQLQPYASCSYVRMPLALKIFDAFSASAALQGDIQMRSVHEYS